MSDSNPRFTIPQNWGLSASELDRSLSRFHKLPTPSITFFDGVLILTPHGFTYKGTLVEDAGVAYETFLKVINQNV